MKEKREDRQRMTMTKVTDGLEIDLAVVIEECHLDIEAEVDSYRTMDRIIERDCKTTTEMTIGEEIIGRHKIIEAIIIELKVETITETSTETIIGTTLGMTTLKEVGDVGLQKDNTHAILEGMIAAVDPYQVQDEDQDPVLENK